MSRERNAHLFIITSRRLLLRVQTAEETGCCPGGDSPSPLGSPVRFYSEPLLMSLEKGHIHNQQARNLRRCALKAGKTSTRKTENLAHLTYPHTESGMR